MLNALPELVDIFDNYLSLYVHTILTSTVDSQTAVYFNVRVN